VLERVEFEPFVQAAAPRASGELRLGIVLKLKGADGAADAVADGEFFAALTLPFKPDPEAKHGRKEQEQVNENQESEADADHSVVAGVGVGAA